MVGRPLFVRYTFVVSNRGIRRDIQKVRTLWEADPVRDNMRVQET